MRRLWSFLLCKQTHVQPLNSPYIISRAVSDQQGGVTNHYTELSATSSTNNAANCHSRQGRSKIFACVSFEIFQPKGVKCIMLCYAMPSPCEILQSLTTFNLRKLQNYPEQKTKSKPVKQRSASSVRLSFARVAGLEVRRHPPGFHASSCFMKCEMQNIPELVFEVLPKVYGKTKRWR